MWPLYDAKNRALGTSLCSACVALISTAHRQRGDKNLHQDGQQQLMQRRLDDAYTRRGVPACERAGAETCDICEHRDMFSSRTMGSPLPIKRRIGAAALEEKAQSYRGGRPPKKKKVTSSISHSSNRGGGRPRELVDVDDGTAEAQHFYEMSRRITKALILDGVDAVDAGSGCGRAAERVRSVM